MNQGYCIGFWSTILGPGPKDHAKPRNLLILSLHLITLVSPPSRINHNHSLREMRRILLLATRLISTHLGRRFGRMKGPTLHPRELEGVNAHWCAFVGSCFRPGDRRSVGSRRSACIPTSYYEHCTTMIHLSQRHTSRPSIYPAFTIPEQGKMAKN